MNGRHIVVWLPHETTTDAVALPAEESLCIYVNGRHLVSIAASPVQQDVLVLGFLHYAGLISSLDEVRELRLSKRRPEGADGGAASIHSHCADVWLDHEVGELPRTWLRTSGCGSGVILGELRELTEPLRHPILLRPEQLLEMRRTLQDHSTLYQETRGVHSSGLFTPEGELLAIAEDIGRHNTLDKLLGQCLEGGIVSDGMVLFTTGRISSEMMSKAAWMRTPIVGSMTAPSSMAVALADAWGITTAGYVRTGQIRIYTHSWRLFGETQVP